MITTITLIDMSITSYRHCPLYVWCELQRSVKYQVHNIHYCPCTIVLYIVLLTTVSMLYTTS